MRTSESAKFLLHVTPTIFSIIALLSGCSSTSKSIGARWVNPDLISGYSTSQRKVRDQWAGKITDLPIELHGILPGQTAMNTQVNIKNVLSSDAAPSALAANNIFSTRQRLVLYIDGVEVPERRDFCTLSGKLRTPLQQDQMLTLRGAVCDGKNIVTYARESESLAAYSSGGIDTQIAQLRKSLIAALYPAPTSKELRDLEPGSL